MTDLRELTAYLDEYLRVAEVHDAPEALNGLQVTSQRGSVTRIAAAVDACMATIRMAAEAGANLLLVHHGLFWRGLSPLTGQLHRRITGLTSSDLALYSAHLPLDCHPEVGNNPLLAKRLGVAVQGPFGRAEGQDIGVWGELDASRAELVGAVQRSLGIAAVRLLGFGPERVRRVGIVTGAGGSMIGQAAAAGLDTLVTGEGAHWTYFDAEELGVNVIYAGHYATETLGVQALAAHLAARFSLSWVFLDHPTGL